MRGNRVVFTPKPPAQDAERCFDFTSLLDEGEELAAASVEVETFSGTSGLSVDNLEIRLDGPRVFAPFSGGEEGSVYTVTCFAGTCNGQNFSLAAYLAVQKAAVE